MPLRANSRGTRRLDQCQGRSRLVPRTLCRTPSLRRCPPFAHDRHPPLSSTPPSCARSAAARHPRQDACCRSCRAGWASAFRRIGSPVPSRGLGAVGTIASVDLRRHHPDLMARERARRQGDRRRRQPDGARPRDPRGEGARRRPRHDRRQRDARGRPSTPPTCGRPARAASTRSSWVPGCRSTCPTSRADYPDVALIPILSDARGIAAGREEVGAQGAPAGCDRHRASALRRRPSRRGEDRGSRRSALRFRARAARRARVLPRRGHRGRRDPADSGRRHQHARADPRAARAGRRRRADRHAVRRHRGRRRRHRVQARAGRRPGPRTSSSS